MRCWIICHPGHVLLVLACVFISKEGMKLTEDDSLINKTIKIIAKVPIDSSLDNKADYKG